MLQLFELGIAESAPGIVEKHGTEAPARIAAEAVELLQAGERHGYDTLIQTLPDVEAILDEY